MITIHACIEGRVQGVWFRGWTQQTARELGLDGWVRNRPDGSVEALFHGPEDKVDTMIERAHIGPPAASVRAVTTSSAEPPETSGFHVQRG